MTVYTLPELGYDYDALSPVINAEIMELHHDKHHAAYVKGANDTLDQLAEARQNGAGPAMLNALEKNLAFHTSGHFLHSTFWTNLSPDGGGSPSGELASLIDSTFGGLDQFKAQLSTVANAIQGSGWASLSWEPNAGILFVGQIYDHQSNSPTGSIPLLVLDMWEHAFYLQYKNVKADWVNNYWDIVNWSNVEQRLAQAKTAPAVI